MAAEPHARYAALDHGLAAELQRLRLAAGLTAKAAARTLRWSGSKVSRVELGRFGITAADTAKLMTLYKVEPGHAARLIARAEAAAAAGRRGTPDGTLHDTACGVQEWAPARMPALLQTGPYARAALNASLPPPPPYQVRQAEEELARRQHRLAGAAAVRAVIDEAVLYRLAGTGEIMAAQLRRLAAPPPGAALRVLPADAGGPFPPGPFTVLTFPELHGLTAPDVVLLPRLDGTEQVTGERDTWAYRCAFEALWAAAADPADPVKRALHHWEHG